MTLLYFCRGMGDKWAGESDKVSGAKYPLLWPSTLPEEDLVRSSGHMTMDTWEWITLLTSHWRHLVLTLLSRAADKLGLMNMNDDNAVINIAMNFARILKII